MPVAAWRIEADTPTRVVPSAIALERDLEGWIERDPALVSEGLHIVGRQITLEGGRLDLLATDLQERWVVIEVKRGRLYRDTLVQALDYASTISTMPEERLRSITRDYVEKHSSARSHVERLTALLDGEAEGGRRRTAVVVVGVGKDSSLDRLVDYLGTHFGVPIQVASLEAFDAGDGTYLLVRELTESDSTEPEEKPAQVRTLEAVLERAEKRGAGRAMRALLEAGTRHGLYARPFKYSLMLAPEANKTRMLYTVWVEPTGSNLRLFVSTDAFAEFFPFNEEDVQRMLGSAGERIIDEQGAAEFATALDELFTAAHASDSQ